jgi:hypothetical protein
VANVGGEFYAVNAKCPHLGLPMKRGALSFQDTKRVLRVHLACSRKTAKTKRGPPSFSFHLNPTLRQNRGGGRAAHHYLQFPSV